jgi:hypothetical protein
MVKFVFSQRTKIIRLKLDTLSDNTVTNTIEIIQSIHQQLTPHFRQWRDAKDTMLVSN